MEVKFNKDWLKREGLQRLFSAARQLPGEMSESGHSEGGADQRDNKGPSLPAQINQPVSQKEREAARLCANRSASQQEREAAGLWDMVSCKINCCNHFNNY